MSATASSGGEATGIGVSNQLASLVPSLDPGVDDLLIYQQKVELVYAAWPRAKTTELVTRLIFGCNGSAFAKLQLHQTELLDGSEKSVQRLVELLGGSWGKIPLELQYQDAGRALFETVQKAEEANESYLARADVLWSRLLSRRMSLEDLQAYILLRGSLLSSEEKKKVILESEQDGKLSVKRVTTAIRTLGANFFMDLTNQKKNARTKIYDQTALYSETIPETEEPDQAFQVQGWNHGRGVHWSAGGTRRCRCSTGERFWVGRPGHHPRWFRPCSRPHIIPAGTSPFVWKVSQ